MKISPIVMLALFCAVSADAQYAWQYDGEAGDLDLGHNIEYSVESQATLSEGKTPLWLNANKYGLSSLDKENGYLRGRVERKLSTDSARRWGVGYGLDMAVASHFTSTLVLQQAYAEGRWLHGVLTIGAKQYPMELKNNRLSSGSQTFGINARPVPQVRIALPKYWTIPGFGRWLHIKGHIAYGKTTDDNWQEDFTDKKSKYTSGTYYHSKAGYIMIGNEDRFCPWSIELGIESATIFGGKSYQFDQAGNETIIKSGSGLSSFYHALIPGGGDAPEKGTIYQNEEGNFNGSLLARFNYEADSWRLGIYGDKYFEDFSSLAQVDYDGYGTGENWNKKEKTRFFLYDFKDWLLGMELNLKQGTWLRNIVFEYLYSKYQSGPVYHDHTQGASDHIAGRDDFYNHYIYTGWQHWGQVMGNPLYRSPIYNTDGRIEIEDNRFMALHLGVDGQPAERFGYRVLATYQEGLGTYDNPYTKQHHNVSFMVEGTYDFPHQWRLQGAYGMDFGKILGGINYGFQLTISKSGVFSL